LSFGVLQLKLSLVRVNRAAVHSQPSSSSLHSSVTHLPRSPTYLFPFHALKTSHVVRNLIVRLYTSSCFVLPRGTYHQRLYSKHAYARGSGSHSWGKSLIDGRWNTRSRRWSPFFPLRALAYKWRMSRGTSANASAPSCKH